MSDTYTGFVVVAVVALCVPLARELIPWVRLPAIVLELCAGIAIGPHGLGLIELDEPIRVFAQIGLAALLFLAGREINLAALRGPVLKLALLAFAGSLGLAVAASHALEGAGVVDAPLLVAIILVSTSLSVLIVPLKDAHQTGTHFGQLVIAAASLAEMAAIILLSFFFSADQEGFDTELLHLGVFVVFAAAVVATLSGGRSFERLSSAFDRLADTTSQIRVRADFALVALAVGVAAELGLEAILAAFTVGVIRGIGQTERPVDAPDKVEVVAFGIFIPFFFVASGLEFDVGALFDSVTSAIELPIFLVAILLVRALPAVFYRREVGSRGAVAAGLLQATTLSFIVVATQIGTELGTIDTATAAAFVGAGLLSVILFPAAGLNLMRGRGPARA